MLLGPGISETFSKPGRGYNKMFLEHNHIWKSLNDASSF